MKVLVTGGTGFIGSHTCVELLQSGHEVIIVDNLFNSELTVLDKIEEICGSRPVFYQTDILDIDSLENIFQNHSFDAVIHFAGHKAVGESVQIPLVYYQNNVSGSLNLYMLMRKYHVPCLVFSSSATVYGDSFPVPFKEEYGMGETTNPYGNSKKINESIIQDLCHAESDFSAVILRYFNPIGAHPSGLLGESPNGIPNNLVPYIAKVAVGKLDHLNVFGNDYDTPDGTGIRDYIHVTDLAKAHVKALEYAKNHSGAEVINVGSGKGYSVLEVLHAYEKACGNKIPYQIGPRRPGDIAVCYADVKKAKELLDFSAELGIEEMCRDSHHFMMKSGKI